MAKQCTVCNRIYDDSENFCESDGAVLASSAQSAETVAVSSPVSGFPSVLPKVDVKPPRPAGFYLVYAVILVLSVVSVGLGVAYFTSSGRSPEAAKDTGKNPENKNTSVSNEAGFSGPKNSAGANQNISTDVDNAQLRTDPPLTVENVTGLLQKWAGAQSRQNFSVYQDCYTSPFKGVKATNKGDTVFDYGGWMADRRKMLRNAIGLTIEIKNLNISIEGDLATATFDQYYRSLRYSDWGPKIIKLKQTPNGPKIVYENLKASYPL